ncbi:hypothetical protein KY366_07160, partial [Candidatus Woesearchaeota archaeon]|nr:hypothetical protein [Candidatus Woesearchaeota archaeon]
MNPSGNKTNKALIKVILTVLIITVIFSLFSSLMPTGFVGIKKEFRYSDSIGLAFNKNQTYTWTMGNYGKLSSVRLDGSVTKRGSAKVYLKYQNNSYLVFDSSRLDHSGLLSITGMALSNTTNQSFQDKNKNETDPAATKRIELYIQGGGSKAEDEVFELKTASSFSWDVDYDKLCTRWSLTSSNSLILPTSAELNEVSHPDAENGSAELINDISSVSLCRGSEECCSFLNMESSGGWDSAMHISYGRYGSGKNNTVSAQVIYYDVDLSVPYSEIVYSSVSSVRADFYEPRTEFRDICLGTCLLPEFNEREYEIILVIENATLNIDKIKYSVRQEVNVSENAPELINRFENVTVYKNDILILNLSKYFKDEDNSWLDYSAYQEDNITISINNPIAAIMPHANFTGKRYMFFNAYDENYNISSNIFAIRVIEKPVKPEKANISEKLI